MPESITTSITWHAGGAIPLPDGTPRPWPEAWGEWSPRITYKWSGEGRVTSEAKIHRDHWYGVAYWCDPSELEPPDFTKGTVDETT